MLEIINLSYSISGKTILKDVSFEIKKGEFIGLLGPNGSGKTTLIKILSGVYRNYQGKANLNLIPIKNLRPKGLAQVVATVPQECEFPFSFSALEIVLMGRFPHKKNFSFDSLEDYQLAKVMMQKTDCWQFAGRVMNSLSGGEKQRVLLARALVSQPKILLLDEPASHLDLKHQQELFNLLKNLHQEGITILCVVHDLNIASLYFDKLVFLKEGKALVAGNNKDVLTPQTIREVFDVGYQVMVGQGEKRFFVPV